MGQDVSVSKDRLEQARSRLKEHGQESVLRFLDRKQLDEKETKRLITQVESLDVKRAVEIFNGSMEQAKSQSHTSSVVTPISPSEVASLADIEENGDKWCDIAYESMSQGKACFLILGGGQGTRLGFDRAKGMYRPGLASGKPLFGLQAERLLRLHQIVRARFPDAAEKDTVRIPLYVMTSPLNDADTRSFFKENRFFGLREEDVVFFAQGMLPCMSRSGEFILERKDTLAMAPDGNGGIYLSMLKEGVLADMERRGVEYIHVTSVDNALVQSADPVFMGYCIDKKVDVGNKGCPKVSWDEKVGVMARKGGKFAVVEYSELSQQDAKMTNEADGRLLFSTGNICNHFFTLPFIRDVAIPGLASLYHVAHKKIPYADEETGETVKPAENNGIKFELFIFDTFSFATEMGIIECERAAEFAPIKNAPGEKNDSPDSARAMIYALHSRWLEARGVTLTGDRSEQSACEITPRVSIRGEGLESVALAVPTMQMPLLLATPADVSVPHSATNVSQVEGVHVTHHTDNHGVNVYVVQRSRSEQP